MSGRIRSLKPEWKEDELLAAASDEARVLSAALILMADDYGNGRASIATIAAETWRYQLEANDGAQAPEVLAKASRAFCELLNIRYVGLYMVDGQKYFAIRNWGKHQRVDKPGKPKVPPPPTLLFSQGQATRVTVASDSREARDGLAPEGNRRERRQEEDPEKSKVLTAAAKTGRHISREKPASAAVAAESGEETPAEPVAHSANSELSGTTEAVAGPSPSSGAQEIPTKVPCPADLRLNHSQVEQLKMQIGLEEWAADELTARFVSKALADPTDCRTLVAWRKSLAVAVAGDWRDPRKKPTKPDSPNAAEIAAAKARREAGAKFLAAEREKLVAESYQEFKEAAETGLAYLGIRRPA